MADKKYTPIEAAVAVLNKAKEMYKESTLAKAITGHEKGVHLPIADPRRQGTSVMGTHVRSPNPDGKSSKDMAQIHSKVTNREMKQIPPPDLGKSEAAPMKGHIKLAKFIGRMESKRGMGNTETGHEKGVATKMNPNSKEGMSTAGANVRLGDESAAKKESVGRMTDAEKIKPKLP